ncbi:histidine utilization repressor [Jiella sp. MQZ9-1]|uniref:Histidine utilization repressor n=1 Tax=Jiella flava TaxID=2816857 RepID=A0A939FUP7_9HYPH|nr:histidine utilization repressor [Jiella flava]MBO0662288.1 histidine utilization repressor [Jiella flava]MCD2470881.1 histidine utilization repressor [Jiella flava]
MTKSNTSRSTLHQTILADLERKIVSGEWPPGHKLPFEVELARSYEVSRMTVNKVMTQLTKAGLIERRKRSGTFVAKPRGQSAILEITDVEAEVRALNLPYSYKLMSSVIRKANRHDAALLEVPGTTDILEIRALHMAHGEPFCLEERLINLGTVPEAAHAPFADGPAGAWLVQRVPWSAAEHKIFAITATADIARLLEIAARVACLLIQRRTWSTAGPVTFVRFTYPGEKHAIVASFTPAAG